MCGRFTQSYTWREAIKKRRDHGEETLADIGRSRFEIEGE